MQEEQKQWLSLWQQAAARDICSCLEVKGKVQALHV
jgi:hypothetical protein